MSYQTPDGSVLLVIDMQNDFITNFESPVFIEGAILCLPSIVWAVKCARESKIPVIWVVREHEPSGELNQHRSQSRNQVYSFQINSLFPTLAGIDVEHFRKHMYTDPEVPGPLISGSAGAAIVSSLLPMPGEIKIVKKRFSAFHQTHLNSILRRMGCVNVVLSGVQTPNCIRATAVDAVSLDYKDVTVLADCSASKSKAVQDSNLRDLRDVGIHTVEINTAGSLLGWLCPVILV